MSTSVQFIVPMDCEKCVESVSKAISPIKGVDSFEISLENNEVIVKGIAPISVLLEALRNTGKKISIAGSGPGFGTAVCQLDSFDSKSKTKGVMWIIQLNEKDVLVELIMSDVSKEGQFGIHIRESGDLSDNWRSTGSHFQNPNSLNKNNNSTTSFIHSGDIGNIEIDSHGNGLFRKTISTNQFQVLDIIGLSVVVDSIPSICSHLNNATNQNANEVVGIVGGIIARSAGVGQNQKRICTCDDPRF